MGITEEDEGVGAFGDRVLGDLVVGGDLLVGGEVDFDFDCGVVGIVMAAVVGDWRFGRGGGCRLCCLGESFIC